MANTIAHQTSVDFTRRVISEPVHIVQGDKTLPQIEVELLADGQPYTIPSGASVAIRYGKPDGNAIVNNAASTSGNTATFTVTEQMSALPGEMSPQVMVTVSGGVAATGSFPLIIDKNSVEGAKYSESELSAFDKAIQAVATVNESVEKAALSEKNAAASEKAAKTSETNAANSAKAASASQKAAAASEKNAAASQKAASDSQAAAKTSETNAGNSAESAKNSETSTKALQQQAAVSANSAEEDATLAGSYVDTIKNLLEDAYAVQDFVENYADIIKDMSEKYQVEEAILDSSGNEILDNFGLPIQSVTYDSATQHAVRDAEQAISLSQSVSDRVTELESWKKSLHLFAHDSPITDSTGADILDSNGNTIGGQVMLLAV